MIKIDHVCMAVGLCLGGLATPALAQRGDPGSLLLFPEYDSDQGAVNFISVTNIDEGAASPVRTRWRYTNGNDCTETDVIEVLSANDQLTVLAGAHIPGFEKGYLSVYAEDSVGRPIVHNQLIGTSTIIDGFGLSSYTIEPFSFPTRLPNVPGALTDVNNNGRLDLDGVEYATVGEQYVFPRFLGQGALFNSRLVLVDLTGGGGFSTVAQFEIYNDNTEVFSAIHEFSCWDKTTLSSISSVTDNTFLHDFTFDDPDEIVGAPELESGWLRIKGQISQESGGGGVIADPAIVALLIESDVSFGTASTHPAFVGSNQLGSLSPDGGLLPPPGGE